MMRKIPLSKYSRGKSLQLLAIRTSLTVDREKKRTKKDVLRKEAMEPINQICMDKVEKVLKSNRYTHLLYKGLRCLIKCGPRFTLRKIKKKLFPQKLKTYTKDELEQQKLTDFPQNIKFSILVPLYNTPRKFLEEMVQSVLEQTYGNWELCMADGSDKENCGVGEICKKYAKQDSRIKYRKLEKNFGISANTNACIDMATGDYVALLDHDDILHPAALYEIMKVICEHDADFIYTDEATFISPHINRIETIHFKPDFAIDNLRANNYICHFSVFKKFLLDDVGTFRSEYDGSQDHDIILRLTAKAKRIIHISKVLYYWRSHKRSISQNISAKEYAIDAAKRAICESVMKSGYTVSVESSRTFPTIFRLKYALKKFPKISIIIPNKNHLNDIKKCIESILMYTTYPNYEIIVIDNGSNKKEVFEYYDTLKRKRNIVSVYSLNIDFNFSKINNFATLKASGDYYIFLNNNTLVITPEWIEEMLMYVQREDIAAAGAMLYYPDNTIQHAGIILGIGENRIAGHPFCKYPKEDMGYMGRLCYAQNMSAVTAACMMVKASVYKQVGGFDENLCIAYNDVDLCLKMRRAGYLIVWTPFAELYHYESKTRGYENTEEKRERLEKETQYFKSRWGEVLEKGDPYYNINLTLDKEDFSLK